MDNSTVKDDERMPEPMTLSGLQPKPVVTTEREYSTKHLFAIERIFGEHGRNVAQGMKIGITIGKAPSQTIIDMETREMRLLMHHIQWRKSVPSVVHEFTHYYVHMLDWDVACKAHSANHEACAILTELLLKIRCPQYGKEVSKRMENLQKNPMEIYQHAMFILDHHMSGDFPQHPQKLMLQILGDLDGYHIEKTDPIR